MKILFLLFLLLCTELINSTSFKDNQTDIYVTPYSGDLIKNGDYIFESSRIIIGVNENVSREKIEFIAKSVGGQISGWEYAPSLYDSYFIDLSPQLREYALISLKSKPEIIYAIRNYHFDPDWNSKKSYYLEPFDNETYSIPYMADSIRDKNSVSFEANSIGIVTNSGIKKEQLQKLLIPYNGIISGQSKHSYDVFLPADQRELALYELATNPQINSTFRNYHIYFFNPEPNYSGVCIVILPFSLIALTYVGFHITKLLTKKKKP